MTERDNGLDGVMSQLGEFGPYQMRQHLLHLMSSFVAGVHMLALSLTAATPEHRCFIPQIDGGMPNHTSNLSHFIPRNPEGKLSSCLKFSSHSSNSSSTESCHGLYTFDPTYFPSSRVIEWSLVCDQGWMRTFLQSIYMVGVLLGALFCGTLADRFGRKPIFYLCAVLQVFFGFGSAFAPNYSIYAISLFFYGAFGSGGIYVTGFVLSMELVGASKRTLCGTLFSLTFAVGEMLVPFWGWILPNSPTVLQMIYAAHGLLLWGHWWLIDESIRWLWSEGRSSEAMQIAVKAVQVNGGNFKSIPMKAEVVAEPCPVSVCPSSSTSITSLEEDNHEPTEGIFNLFRHPRLSIRLLIMAVSWFANAMVYYGLTFYIGTLPGNPFLMGFLIGLVEIPGYLINMLLLDRMGRRSLGSILCFLGGVACILISFTPQGNLVIILAMLAKVAIAGSFAICYNYGVELFPTSVRNSVLGIMTVAARGAGILTPVVILLAEVGNDRAIPTLVYGGATLTSSFLVLFLPETKGKEMPQMIEDGEEFGRGDTAFTGLSRRLHKIWRPSSLL